VTQPITLFELNPALNREALAEQFSRDGRIQIRDFLTDTAARNILQILSRETPWGLAWRAGANGPHGLRRQQTAAYAPADWQKLSTAVAASMRGGDYAFVYSQYQILTAVQQGWNEHPGLEALIEHINDEPLMELVRQVTATPELRKADAQATLYGPNHFLGMHDDGHVGEGWQIAYVMNFCAEDWRPDWGGYLNFYDEEGDVVAGFKPRFNALNMFRVPQRHNVTYVPPFAPAARFAVTGWFRDR
jgi:Rps23 Pro-64 3,4-dihydroxylase Tpa1-like proline 4-hydroxylase